MSLTNYISIIFMSYFCILLLKEQQYIQNITQTMSILTPPNLLHFNQNRINRVMYQQFYIKIVLYYITSFTFCCTLYLFRTIICIVTIVLTIGRLKLLLLLLLQMQYSSFCWIPHQTSFNINECEQILYKAHNCIKTSESYISYNQCAMLCYAQNIEKFAFFQKTRLMPKISTTVKKNPTNESYILPNIILNLNLFTQQYLLQIIIQR
eukprot:TRINITY_DN3400_c0_g1_i11.p2 TRINITY_DN3400_c0_g1~~TRINITY_DN3400_c0_g1_i11.p2  ORF type:complete len:208 (+),score=-22.58 TRINITY_DN3400_c0_g1_i11:496-1119(+)